MKPQKFILFFSIFALFIGISCTSSKRTQTDAIASEEQKSRNQTVVPDTFILPDIPTSITHPEARAEYLSMHFWDRFDFQDKKLISREDVTEQALVDYINILNYIPAETQSQSIENTLAKASAESGMYNYFARLFDKYLHEPNSPFHNDELYLPVLENVVKSPDLPEIDKSKYQLQLEMAKKNRVGKKSTDFTYTTASGRKSNLHSIASEYLLLLFIDPDCSTCKTAMKQIGESQAIKSALRMNVPGRTMLTILTVYPDGNLDEWKANIQNLPGEWINSYDADMAITQKKLYDIKAYPTIYLLDKNKNVILKDVPAETVDAFFAHPS